MLPENGTAAPSAARASSSDHIVIVFSVMTCVLTLRNYVVIT